MKGIKQVSPQSRYNFVRFEVLMAGCYLLVTANVVPSSLILVTLITEATRSSETSILTTAARRHIPEDGIP
jgi:hypothetical protein